MHLWGVEFEWDLGNYTWEQVQDWPITVAISFSYSIKAHWVEDHGSANAGIEGPNGWRQWIGVKRVGTIYTSK